ncbi:MAG TPA: class I SAM-dependent methyltransferase [Bryobacteraceae bacterium]|jgi:ubiquinone/menaquinone biosynthesis C-methylase UbiE|nr:class I SAM-dependent methyltransferase [Bryobacteraceae bacterium]
MDQAMTMKPYKGIGMNGPVAKWYASMTRKSMPEFTALARRVADEVPDGARVLEVAPGPGYFSIELAKLGRHRVTGLDISPSFVKIGRRNAAQAGVSVAFQEGNASAMPFPSQSFDFILCRAAFKNFAEPVKALEEMYRVLDTNGRALIIDLRGDVPPKQLDAAVNEWKLSGVNTVLTKLTFRFMLLKRAYTTEQFRELLSHTKFQSVDIKEFVIGLEVSLQRTA